MTRATAFSRSRVELHGTFSLHCASFNTGGDIVLGDNMEDAIYINSHFRNSEFVFDSNMDGVALTSATPRDLLFTFRSQSARAFQ